MRPTLTPPCAAALSVPLTGTAACVPLFACKLHRASAPGLGPEPQSTPVNPPLTTSSTHLTASTSRYLSRSFSTGGPLQRRISLSGMSPTTSTSPNALACTTGNKGGQARQAHTPLGPVLAQLPRVQVLCHSAVPVASAPTCALPAADLAQGVGVPVVHHVETAVHVHADRAAACSTNTPLWWVNACVLADWPSAGRLCPTTVVDCCVYAATLWRMIRGCSMQAAASKGGGTLLLLLLAHSCAAASSRPGLVQASQ